MTLRVVDSKNFNVLLRAARNGHLSLLECKDAKTGEYRAVLCAIHMEGNEYVMTPFGHLCPDNPYEAYTPPEPVEDRSGDKPYPG